MITENIADRVYFKSELIGKMPKITHFFTTKCGGFSDGEIGGLNLGFRVGDNPQNVEKNYRQIASDFKLDYSKITAAKQTHSTDIRVISEEECGCGVSRIGDTFEADGLVTNCVGVPVLVFYADCVPILLAEEDSGVVAAVHSGWRGTVCKIVKNAVDIMTRDFGAVPEKIKAAIGPSIGKCCFETGEEVAEHFADHLKERQYNGKFKVDLWQANKEILLKSGLIPQNIDVLGMCTMCRSDILYSYRTHGKNTGRMGACIMLKDGRI